MIKNNLDYKLINITFIALIIYLIYQTSGFWTMAVSTILKCLRPFLISFIIAYVLNNFVSRFTKYNIPRFISCFLVIILTIVFLFLPIYLLSPILFEQLSNIFGSIITFVKEVGLNKNVDFSEILDDLYFIFNNVLENFGSFIYDGAFNLIGISLEIVSQILVSFAMVIYLLLDFEKLKGKLKNFLLKKSKMQYYYFKTINNELNNYIDGFFKIVVISFFEYGIIYYVIGHPNFIFLGILAGIMNFIPYFGGIITNFIAIMTAFVVGFDLFIKTLIVMFIFGIIDSFIINPLVYKKSNSLHPLIVIVSIFVFSSLFGFFGTLFAVPFTIILMITFKFYRKDGSVFSNLN